MSTVLYPDGYGSGMVTLAQMKQRHGARMHPEFARRFFPYIESKGGRMGTGGGRRTTQPTGPTFAANGKSFHQDQLFASGFIGYAAVDLVMAVPGQVHRAPTWAETDDAAKWGLHTFIRSPEPEPWHIQCIEMRGWQAWVNAGRPDPQPRPLPNDPSTPLSPIGAIVTTTSEWQQTRVADITFHGDQLVRVPQAAGKQAVTVALHVVVPDHAGYVTAFLGPRPDVSTVNYSPGVVSDATTTVPVDGDGWFALNSTGRVRVLVDLIGVHSAGRVLVDLIGVHSAGPS